MNLKSKKIILGIDPGTSILGFGVIKIENKKTELIELDVLMLKKISSHEERLKRIFDKTSYLIENYKVDEVAIEAPFYGKNIQSMLKLGRAQGVAIIATIKKNKKVYEYAPKKIKLSVTGSGKSSKEQVSSMLMKMLNIKTKPKYFDATDGLAVAVCHSLQNIIQVKSTGNRKKGWENFIKNNPGRLR